MADADCAVNVSAPAFDRAVRQVLSGVPRDTARRALRLVRIEISTNGLRMVSTDSLRLIVTEIPGAVGATPPAFALVGPDGLAGILPLGTGEVRVGITPTHVEVATGADRWTFPATTATFPNYEPYLEPCPAASTCTSDRQTLLAALEDQPDGEPLRIRMVDDGLEVGSVLRITIDASRGGPPQQLFIDASLLHDAVDCATGPHVAIEVESPTHPVIVRSPGDDTFVAVIMPLRIGPPSRRRS